MRYIEPGNILQDLDGKMSAGVTVSDQHTLYTAWKAFIAIPLRWYA